MSGPPLEGVLIGSERIDPAVLDQCILDLRRVLLLHVQVLVRLFFFHIYFPAPGQPVVTGIAPFPPRFLASIFVAHRVQQSHCSSIFHLVRLMGCCVLVAFVLLGRGGYRVPNWSCHRLSCSTSRRSFLVARWTLAEGGTVVACIVCFCGTISF